MLLLANDMSTDIKLQGNLPGSVSNLTSNAIKKFARKKVEKELPEQKKNLLYLFRMKM